MSKPTYEHFKTLYPEGSHAAKMHIGCPSHMLREDYKYFSGNSNFSIHPSSNIEIRGFVCGNCGTEVWFKLLTDKTLL